MTIETIEVPEPATIDLAQVGRKIAARRWWVITSVLLVTALFAVAAFLMTPVYRATAVLISATSERSSMSGSLSSALGQLGGLASLAGINVGTSDPDIEEALAVLRSRAFTEAFIKDYNLTPQLFPKDVGPKSSVTPGRAYKRFDEGIRTIAQDKKTGLISLQIDWKDRNEAAVWANALVKRLNAEMRGRAIAQADASIGFLENELATTNDVGTREAINRLIESQVKQRMLSDVTEQYAFRVVDQALPPDADDVVRPRKVVMILGGALLGLVLGCSLALIRSATGN